MWPRVAPATDAGYVEEDSVPPLRAPFASESCFEHGDRGDVGWHRRERYATEWVATDHAFGRIPATAHV